MPCMFLMLACIQCLSAAFILQHEFSMAPKSTTCVTYSVGENMLSFLPSASRFWILSFQFTADTAWQQHGAHDSIMGLLVGPTSRKLVYRKTSIVWSVLATLLKKDVYFFHYLPISSLRIGRQLDCFNHCHDFLGIWHSVGLQQHDHMVYQMGPASGKRP